MAHEDRLASNPECDPHYYAARVLYAVSAGLYLEAETVDQWADDELAMAGELRRENRLEMSAECWHAHCVLRGLAHDIRSAS